MKMKNEIEITKEEGDFKKNQKMAFGEFIKKLGQNIKNFANDFKDGFKHGWNKTKSIIEMIPVVGNVAKVLPKFDNSNNPVSQYFGGDGYVKFDKNGKLID